ncbi:MAG TPA: hypothetical protein VKX17_23895 [Planctomycetota bacterium]|nr:hypothetical protein [Planctomycetota bacterium]
MAPAKTSAVPVSISFKLLLWIYAILPLCLLAWLIDSVFFHSALLPYLPLAPERFFWLSLLFGTPHIIASNIILFSNREYIERFKMRLLLATLFIAAFFGGGYFFLRAISDERTAYNVLFALIATATVVHVVKQQIGIGNATARLSGLVFQCWAWSIIGGGIVLYNAIFLESVFSPEQKTILLWLMIASCAVTLVLACVLYRRIAQPMGRAFFVANSAMTMTSVILYSKQYYFFAVLGPRVVHDVTAFVFYMAHDYNRHHAQAKNSLYKMLNALHVSAFLAVPVLAIAVTFALQAYGDQAFDAMTVRLFNVSVPNAITLGFIGYLSLLHYYTEAFTWKGDSPYKKYVAFKRAA